MYDNDRITGTDYEYDMHLSKVVSSLLKDNKSRYEKVKFVSTTNDKFKYFENQIGELLIEDFAIFENDEYELKTSLVKGKRRKDNILEIKTKNSMYIFEIIS